ncbi:MAG: zf-HC2 domain-containing protein [Candidatus Limnocylindrales bacterium]
MKPEYPASLPAVERLHERARSLAIEAIDSELEPFDAAWLEAHLGTCPECNAIAEQHRAIHLELRSLEVPEPPRDLWARTSAALDAIEGRASGTRRSRPLRGKTGRSPLFGTAIAVGFVVLVAGASLIAQSPIARIVPGITPPGVVALATGSSVLASQVPQAPLAVVDGTSYWIASGQGVYQIMGSTADCVPASGSCTVNGASGQTLGSITSDTSVSAVIAPDASQAAVWTDNKIVIVPLSTSPQPVALDLLTPRPTLVATPTLAVTPTPVSTATPEITPSAASPAAIQSAAVSIGPSAIASLVATAAPTAPPTPSPAPTVGPAVTKPTAILDGYEIVGRNPEFSADGSLVAFSARPVDHRTGPDVFIWRSGQEQARAVTSRHSDLFAGWFGQRILVSEIAAGTCADATAATAEMIGTTSCLFDPASGDIQRIDRPMLVAGVDPTGRYLIYWSGAVEFDTVSGLWQPGKGELYFDRWADLTLVAASPDPKSLASQTPAATDSVAPSLEPSLSPVPAADQTAPPTEAPSTQPGASGSLQPSATPSAAAKTPEPTQSALPQLLSIANSPASVRQWVVRWDAAGQNVAVWVADGGSTEIGRLSVFSVDPSSGLLSATMGADEVLSAIVFDNSNFVYTSAVDGKTYMKPVPVMPPALVATATPRAPSQAPGAAVSSGGPASASDRPGS